MQAYNDDDNDNDFQRIIIPHIVRTAPLVACTIK